MKEYAGVAWTAEDVRTLAPQLTDAEAEKWLSDNSKHLLDRLIELGWEVLEVMLGDTGIKTGGLNKQE